MEIEVISINEPIPDEVFTLAGLGLREATPVYTDIYKKGAAWDGSKLVPVNRSKKSNIPVEDQPRSRRWLYFVSIMTGLSSLILFIYIYFRRSPQKPSTGSQATT